MTQKTKSDFNPMPYWKNEEKCFDEVVVTGKDIHGKNASTTWPRDEPLGQTTYKIWLDKVKDPDTGEFYHQRDKDGNIIKGTGPKHLIKQIVRIRATDEQEYLYSNGWLLGYDAAGDPVRETCQSPETWQHTNFEYKKEYDPNSMSVKSKPIGPSGVEIIFEMPFTPENLKTLYDKRITPEYLKLLRQTRIPGVSFALKDGRNGVVKEVKDPTGITSKTFELFSSKPFEYLFNADYISAAQKAELRQQAVDMGLLPPVQVQGAESNKQLNKPPSGTYS